MGLTLPKRHQKAELMGFSVTPATSLEVTVVISHQNNTGHCSYCYKGFTTYNNMEVLFDFTLQVVTLCFLSYKKKSKCIESLPLGLILMKTCLLLTFIFYIVSKVRVCQCSILLLKVLVLPPGGANVPFTTAQCAQTSYIYKLQSVLFEAQNDQILSYLNQSINQSITLVSWGP